VALVRRIGGRSEAGKKYRAPLLGILSLFEIKSPSPQTFDFVNIFLSRLLRAPGDQGEQLIQMFESRPAEVGQPGEPTGGGAELPHPGPSPGGSGTAVGPQAKMRSFHGMAEIPSASAKMRLVQLADEIIAVLCSDPNAALKITVDIAAEFPDGAADQVKRAVSENARSLGLKSADWE
jgi:hypothetical protein